MSTEKITSLDAVHIAFGSMMWQQLTGQVFMRHSEFVQTFLSQNLQVIRNHSQNGS